MNGRNAAKGIGLAFLVVILAVLAVFHFRVESRGDLKWAFYPEPWTRQALLKITPPGTSLRDCVRLIKTSLNYDVSDGLRIENNGATFSGIHPPVTGVKFVVIKLSNLRYKNSLLSDEVHASYGFDENGRLIDILVEKSSDGP